MRVLMMIHSLRRGGAERVAIEVARGLRVRGHAVLIVPLLATNEYPTDSAGLPVTSLIPPNQYRWPSAVPRMARQFLPIVKSFDPDVIQTHTPTAAVVLRWAERKIPRQHVTHGYGAITRAAGWKGWVNQRLDRWARGGCHGGVTVVAESMRTIAAGYLGRPGYEIRCVPNGVDLERFPFVERSTPAALSILTIGTLASVKRPDLAIGAMPRLLQLFPGAELRLAGEGPLREALQRQIRSLALEGRVHLLGRRTDVATLCAKADVCWHLSQSEGLPLAIVEAMSTGLPVIGHDVRGVRDIVTDGRNGFLVPYEDTEQLVQRTITLVRNRDLYMTLARGARARVEECFSSEQMIAGHEAALADQVKMAAAGNS